MNRDWPLGTPFFDMAARRDLLRREMAIGEVAWQVPIKYLLVCMPSGVYIVANTASHIDCPASVVSHALLTFGLDEMFAAFVAYDMLHTSP